jgi:capsular exopolysaccharide synthesis family protein
MKVLEYIQLIRKWWWLLAIAVVVAGAGGYFYMDQQPIEYQASVLLSVGSYIESPNPNSSEIQTGEHLAQTYVVLARTRDVLQGTIDTGDFDISTNQLNRMLDTEIIGGTSLIRLHITSTDPQLSADIANEMAEQIILNSPSNLTPEQEEQIELAREEIVRQQVLLSEMTARLDEINSELEDATSDSGISLDRIEQLRASRDLLIDQINDTSANIAEFSLASSSLQARTNSVDILEGAVTSTQPIRGNPFVTGLIGALVGAAGVLMVVLLLEYIDDTIKSPEDALSALGLTVMGKIPNFGGRRDDYPARLVTATDPSSRVSEEFRSIRTRLIYATNQQENMAYVVTSPGAGEGKSVVAANLAVALAQADYRVLLVDADMRRPSQHEVFGMSNEQGLSTLLTTEPSLALKDRYTLVMEEPFADCIQHTDVPNLRVITTGPSPDNPAELIGSSLMYRWYKIFEYADNVDVILFDTPPTLSVADTAVLTATTGAPVLLVVRSRKTRRSAALEAQDQFRQLGRDVTGVVLNSIKDADMTSGATYYNTASTGSMETLPRESLTILRADPSLAALAGSSNGKAREKQTDQLNKPRTMPVNAPDDIKRNSLVLFVDEDNPISMMVNERITLGRHTDVSDMETHVDLDEFGAFDAGVSRIHTAIYRKGSGFYIEDLNSSNGTFLEGVRLEAGRLYRLPSGSVLQLGEMPLRAYYLTEEEAEAEAEEAEPAE